MSCLKNKINYRLHHSSIEREDDHLSHQANEERRLRHLLQVKVDIASFYRNAKCFNMFLCFFNSMLNASKSLINAAK